MLDVRWEFSQLIHIFSLMGLIEKISMWLMESHLKSTPPSPQLCRTSF